MLRLCVQKLCGQLGESETNLSVSIGNLVKKGLPALIQQALDIVRVIGNNSVHPGVIDLRDDRETALALFKLLNKIAEVMITEPREIAAMYETLPAAAREQIERRDTT